MWVMVCKASWHFLLNRPLITSHDGTSGVWVGAFVCDWIHHTESLNNKVEFKLPFWHQSVSHCLFSSKRKKKTTIAAVWKQISSTAARISCGPHRAPSPIIYIKANTIWHHASTFRPNSSEVWLRLMRSWRDNYHHWLFFLIVFTQHKRAQWRCLLKLLNTLNYKEVWGAKEKGIPFQNS